jgi:flagellar hook-length control protein FliK
MSIELSGSTNPAKGGAGVDNGKGQVKSREDVKSSEEGDFSSILTSLDSPVDEVDDGNKPSKLKNKSDLAGSLSSDILSAPMSLMLPDAAVPQAPDVMLDSLSPAASVISSEMAMLLAQADEMSGNQLGAFGEGAPVGGRGMRVGLAKVEAETPDISARAFISLGTEKAENFKQNRVALLDETASALLGQVRNVRVAELQSAAAASLVESRALTQSFIADAAMHESALSGALLSSGLGEEMLRQTDRLEVASLPKTAGSGVEAIWGQQAFQAEHHVDAPAAIADASMLSPEQTVADTVSYWVTQGVQNAELTLDGFGGESIGVSISLKGDEARINFRTDQPEVRQILEGAVAHLKDLLSSEGLVLSGVSVGGSGQEDAGAQERRNRPDPRQTTIVTADVGPTENQSRVNKPVGTGLDLYV